jgi:pimeloyl-ACP methyl ester carboxylesterase
MTNIKKENFNIPGAKGRGMLADITYDPDNKDVPVVIFAHGFKGFKDWGAHDMVARHFAKNGFRYLKFNFSHNGTTADKPVDFADLIAFSENTFSIELEDLNRVINFACDGPLMPPVEDIFLIGHSMGGGISIVQTAEDKRVKKLVTMASISGFGHLWPKEVEEQWKLSGILYIPNMRTGQAMPLKATLLDDLERNPGRLDILAKAAEIEQPWLITHGSEDKTVSFESANQLGKAAKNALLSIIPEADHTFGAVHPYAKKTLPKQLHEFCDEAIEFLKKQ